VIFWVNNSNPDAQENQLHKQYIDSVSGILSALVTAVVKESYEEVEVGVCNPLFDFRVSVDTGSVGLAADS
jgi:hypothetical protein